MNEADAWDTFHKMRDAGASPEEVFLAAQEAGLDRIELIRLVRKVFGLSLVEAKEVMIVAEGRASSLSEYQEQFIPIFETLLEEEGLVLPLSEWRLRREWTLEQLAEEAGVSTLTLQSIENGDPVQDKEARKIADALAVLVDQVVEFARISDER